jgi:spore coat polysaccharide biosynthesis protein SpsF
MALGIVVFSRFDSRRLPGKAMRPIAGRPMLGWVLDRARRIETGGPVVVATSNRPSDDIIAHFTEAEGVSVFRGSAGDVAGRALACAEAYGFTSFLRVCGDSPFYDPVVAERVLRLFKAQRLDVATNTFPRSFPAGVSAEVISTDAMRRAVERMTEDDEREHITRHFYRHSDVFRIENFACGDERYASIHLAVDTPEDLEKACWIAERIESPAQTPISTVVNLAIAYGARNPPLRKPLNVSQGR